jgi:aspartate/methionine/tyrosine aminotransferase
LHRIARAALFKAKTCLQFKIDEFTATTYTGTTIGGVGLRRAVAKHINKYFNPTVPVGMKEVGIANGVTAICSMLAFMGNLKMT